MRGNFVNMELCIIENYCLYHTPDAQKNEHNGNGEEFVVDMMEIRPELLWCDVLLNFLHLHEQWPSQCTACVHVVCMCIKSMAHTLLQWLSRYTNITLYSVDFCGVADHSLFGIISMATSPSSAGSKMNLIDIIALTNNVRMHGYRINGNCTSIIIVISYLLLMH